jgi:hypothetical protein
MKRQAEIRETQERLASMGGGFWELLVGSGYVDEVMSDSMREENLWTARLGFLQLHDAAEITQTEAINESFRTVDVNEVEAPAEEGAVDDTEEQEERDRRVWQYEARLPGYNPAAIEETSGGAQGDVESAVGQEA